MARGKPGADSNGLVNAVADDTKNLLEASIELMGETPVFWGRYFKGPKNPSHEQYQAALENQILNSNGIRVLPIARQTNRVNGSEAHGLQDATANVDAVFDAFTVDYLKTQGSSFYMFLDTEPGVTLSTSYYTGWAKGVIARSQSISGNNLKILPCVYLNKSDTGACHALTAAVQNHGAECHGAYVAHYLPAPCSGLVDWNDVSIAPAASIPCKVLIWQYCENCYTSQLLDGNQVNPSINLQTELLDKLILPPAP